MFKNKKNIEDTYATKAIVHNIAGQVQMKEVMADKTPTRYALKSMMAGFLLLLRFSCSQLKHNLRLHIMMD